MEYDATATKILDVPPYIFFAVVGVVFASSLFILLLLKYDYSIPRYTKIFLLSGAGLLAGAKLFGCLTGLYITLSNNEPITLDIFLNTGIVFYGGVIGFLFSFMLICEIWNRKVDRRKKDGRVVEIAVVCIPLFHFWARIGCFFAGCCYGIETDSRFSVLYTNYVHEEIITVLRVPVQLAEAFLSIAIFSILLILLSKRKFEGHLIKVYLLVYATTRIVLEFFRGDSVRGVWNGVSFSQVVSGIVLISYILLPFIKKYVERENENY